MFRSFDAPGVAPAHAEANEGTPAQQFTQLVSRYPDLGEIELARLINLYRELSALDWALMISDESLGPNVERFFAENRSKIKTPLRHYAVLVAIAVMGVAAIAWSTMVVQ
jgi:hypothetical protein